MRARLCPDEDSSAAKHEQTRIRISAWHLVSGKASGGGAPRAIRKEAAMRTFLGTVLSVIAVGVLLIAYGLLSPRAAAAPFSGAATDPYAYQVARPMPASDIVTLGQPSGYDPYSAARAPIAYPVSDVRAVRTVQT